MESEHKTAIRGSSINFEIVEPTTGQLLESITVPAAPQSETKIVALPLLDVEKGETQTPIQVGKPDVDEKDTTGKDAALSSFSGGLMDKVAPVSATSDPWVDEPFVPPATRLRRRLEDSKDLIVCPGVYDGLSARIAMAEGCDAMYMTGAGTTASALGMADLGLATLNDMVRQADMIANLDMGGPPLIADMDTGYGGPITIATAVRHYIRANVAGFHIEDQVLTKRCGHLSGKKVVAREVFYSRIRAAKEAIKKARSDIVLIARTDANQQLGFEESIIRLRAARDLGADCGLLEGFQSKEQAREAVVTLAPWPLLLNVVENGHSPLITVDEAHKMGFRIIIFSFAGIAPAYGAIKTSYRKLREEGVTGNEGKAISPIELFELCGLQDAIEVDNAAGGEDFKDGV